MSMLKSATVSAVTAAFMLQIAEMRKGGAFDVHKNQTTRTFRETYVVSAEKSNIASVSIKMNM